MKNYFVVGGSSGIGKAISEMLASDGHQVFNTFNTTPIEVQTGISSFPLNVLDDEYDLGFLPEVIDGFVYCPGSIQLRPFARLKLEMFSRDFELQVLGAIRVLQLVLPRIKAAQQSSIVLFSTVAVQKGFNFHSQVAVSKGAIEGLTRSLAAELAPSIRVNAIAPSLTDTPLASKLLSSEEKKEANAQRHPLKKFGTPENIADAALYLLSEKSSWMTGQIIHVDGGLSSINL
jgi:NAD(P)-dependent dehydrogenase (short-subunit alcohol dehydrogenase family)